MLTVGDQQILVELQIWQSLWEKTTLTMSKKSRILKWFSFPLLPPFSLPTSQGWASPELGFLACFLANLFSLLNRSHLAMWPKVPLMCPPIYIYRWDSSLNSRFISFNYLLDILNWLHIDILKLSTQQPKRSLSNVNSLLPGFPTTPVINLSHGLQACLRSWFLTPWHCPPCSLCSRHIGHLSSPLSLWTWGSLCLEHLPPDQYMASHSDLNQCHFKEDFLPLSQPISLSPSFSKS